MAPLFRAYIICWSTACLAAAILLYRGWRSYGLSQAEYWQFLLKPWRAATFVIAATGMVVIAPYTGDPTWDYFDAFFMSTLTYVTAPWAIGAIYKVVKRKVNPSQGFVALCLWMFSASWSYDLYMVLKEGDYPITWFSNIFASSVLYILAGLFWSLDWIRGRGVVFSFMENNWPYGSSNTTFTRILLYMLPFMALVSFLILYFFWFKIGV